MDKNNSTRTQPSQKFSRRRLVAVAALLVALGGCSSDDPRASVFGDAAALARDTILPGPDVAAPDPSSTTTSTTAAPVAETTTVVPTTRRPATRLIDPTPETTAKPRTTPPVVSEPSTTAATTPKPVEPQVGPVSSHGGPVRDHVSLVDNLRARGLTVMPISSVSQPFLHGDGTVLAISGAGIGPAQLQSFQYDSAEAAAADAATFRPDGNPQGFMVDWVAPPHLYLRGRVLVIYVGSDRSVTGLLTDLLGPQFAGR